MKVFVPLIPLLVALVSIAQDPTQSDTRRMTLLHSGPIIHRTEVVGYYLFYKVEKARATLNNFSLVVIDENLRKLNEVSIIRNREFNVLSVKFNGTAFVVTGYVLNNEYRELISFDKSLNQLGSALRMVNNVNLFPSITAVDDQGFLLYGLSNDPQAHRIEFLSNDLRSKWVDEGRTSAYEQAFPATHSRRFIASIIDKSKDARLTDPESDLQVNRVSNGQRLFRAPIGTDEQNLSADNVYYDSTRSEFVVFGEYFNKKDNRSKDRSRGFMTMIYDTLGAVKDKKLNSWEDLGKVTPLNDRGKFEENKADILIHSNVRTIDGEMFVIGEQFKKTGSAGGIAATILLPGSPTTKINVYNMVIMQFDPQHNIRQVHVFEKPKSGQAITGGLVMSAQTMAEYARSINLFDYRFTSISRDQSTFSVHYMDRSASGSNYTIGSIIYTPEKKFTVDKFIIPRSFTTRGTASILPAKEGYILITEYSDTERKYVSRLEKINY